MAETRFHTLLRAKIDAAMRELADNLASGLPVEQYHLKVGVYQGLKDALKYCEEVEREFD